MTARLLISAVFVTLFQHPDHLHKAFHIALVEAGDDDRIFAARGRVDEADTCTVVGHDHADMAHRADAAVGTGKEDKVAGAGFAEGYFRTLVGKVDRGAGYGDTKVAKHIADEAGAVEAGGGRGAAIAVRLAQEALGEGHEAIGPYGIGRLCRDRVGIEAVDGLNLAGLRGIAAAGEEQYGQYEVYAAHMGRGVIKSVQREGRAAFPML